MGGVLSRRPRRLWLGREQFCSACKRRSGRQHQWHQSQGRGLRWPGRLQLAVRPLGRRLRTRLQRHRHARRYAGEFCCAAGDEQYFAHRQGRVSRIDPRAVGLAADRQCHALRHRRSWLGTARQDHRQHRDRCRGDLNPCDRQLCRSFRMGRRRRRRGHAGRHQLDRPAGISALSSKASPDSSCSLSISSVLGRG